MQPDDPRTSFSPPGWLEKLATHPFGIVGGAALGAFIGFVAGLAAGPLTSFVGALAGAVVGGVLGGSGDTH
ncbi:MAG TPA: hypothetical protein VLK85_20200 [Ramlibacter sp.]|nr:hypothetical protein [Ramlibacter sp.]